ncbi:uncharacterized protein TNCV_4921551 [Trichonephila clavipes]|nr:uncharacterized protein TNCV_4921551 [Trichonephila clavipes]
MYKALNFHSSSSSICSTEHMEAKQHTIYMHMDASTLVVTQPTVLRSFIWAYGSLSAPNPTSGGEFDAELSFRFHACFFKCTPGKIEHSGKKDTSAIGNYILVDFNQVNNLLRSAKCQYCKKQTLKLELGAKLGFSYNLKLLCSNCDENKTVVNTSLKSVPTSHDVNLRITQAFSHIGKGYSFIEKFCMVINLDPFSSTTYGKCARRLDNAYTLASENIFAEIHREIKNVYENGAESQT